MIPYGRQNIIQSDIDAVVSVLQSDFLTQGPTVPAFEQALAERVRSKHASASNSATSSLHAACLALELGKTDALWTSPITFVASANCGRYCGAEVDFVDIDADTFNICPDALEAKLIQAERAGKLPKILVPVHMCGQSPDMVRIKTLADRYGIRVIEDASHSIGASFQDQPVGNCAYSDITVFSFHPVKIITTAEGGMATTQNDALATRLNLFRSHGITRDPSLMTHESHGPWYYQQIELGLNYRMTELQAALGLSQMDQLETFVDRRNYLADRYDTLLADVDITLPGRLEGARSSFHLYIIRLPKADKARHRRVFEALLAGGIGVNLHYIPVHLQPYYRQRGFAEGNFPIAEDYYARAISIPLYPGLTEADQDKVVETLKQALGDAD